jgi:mevalonate kinase
LELYHAGTPAESTGEMVAAVARLLRDAPERARSALEAIEDATCQARELLLRSDAGSAHEHLRPLIVRAEAALEDLEVVPGHVASAIRRIEAAGGAAKVSGAGGRTAGAGLVLVLPPAGVAVAVPAAWARLTCRLDAPGLLEDVAA